MAMNISINKALVFMISIKNYSCHSVFNKKNISTFDVLTFMQMCSDGNKFWQIINTSGNGCVQVRKVFDKWLCKKSPADCHEHKPVQKNSRQTVEKGHVSNIVNEVIRTILSLLIFFFTKNFRALKMRHKQKPTNKTKISRN